jgi:small subunit ribosomal protein S17
MNMPEGTRRTRLKGTVTRVKTDKTVVVTVQRRTQHPLYKKRILRHKRYPAHDEHNRCRQGDLVEIISTRPLSRTKRWAVVKVLKPAETSPAEAPREQEALR